MVYSANDGGGVGGGGRDGELWEIIRKISRIFRCTAVNMITARELMNKYIMINCQVIIVDGECGELLCLFLVVFDLRDEKWQRTRRLHCRIVNF